MKGPRKKIDAYPLIADVGGQMVTGLLKILQDALGLDCNAVLLVNIDKDVDGGRRPTAVVAMTTAPDGPQAIIKPMLEDAFEQVISGPPRTRDKVERR